MKNCMGFISFVDKVIHATMLFWLSKTKRLEIYFSMLYVLLTKILTVH